jgi:hypothetical protein
MNVNKEENFKIGAQYSIGSFFFSFIFKFVFLITELVFKFINTKEKIIHLSSHKLKEVELKKNNSVYKKTIFIENQNNENEHIFNENDILTENEYFLLLIKYRNENNEYCEIDVTKYLNIVNFYKLKSCTKKEITREYLKLKNIEIGGDDFEVYGIKNGIDLNLKKLF